MSNPRRLPYSSALPRKLRAHAALAFTCLKETVILKRKALPVIRTRFSAAMLVLLLFLSAVPISAAPVSTDHLPFSTTALSSKPKKGVAILRQAFLKKRTGFFVKFQATVIVILSDDNTGSRHQRFIVRLSSGQTLLIAHNIDLARRVAGIKKGSKITIHGEYIWSEKGGTIHKTHRTMNSRDPDGWIRHKGVLVR